MTNNPTIDGVRKLAERACGTSPCSPEYKRFVAAMAPTLLLDLTVPVVERQPVGYVHQWEMERIAAGNVHWATMRDSDGANNPSRNGSPAMAVYLAPPEVAALQSTIAQLQARVQELESGRGEPVCYQARHSANEPWFFTDKPGYWEWRPLFTAPPAPVAVKLEMAHVVRAHMEIPNCPVMTSNQCHALAVKLNACLDATAALNGVRK